MCFSKVIFLKKKQKIIIAENSIVFSVFQVLEKFFKTVLVERENVKLKKLMESELIIFSFSESTSWKKMNFWAKHSSLPILVISDSSSLPEESKEFTKNFPSFGYLVLNFDDEKLRELSKKTGGYGLTFGFEEGANLRATDCHFDEKGVSFKLNFNGNILPVWLSDQADRKRVYTTLAILSIAQILNLNLVEVSKALHN